jgi:hypothetical protein
MAIIDTLGGPWKFIWVLEVHEAKKRLRTTDLGYMVASDEASQ